MNDTSNTADVIDSRDVIARIEELTEQEERDADEQAELASLRKLAHQGVGVGGWEHGVQLVRESYFTRYAQEIAEDCGMVKDNAQWPYTCIDWEWAARELKHDYTAIDYDGVTYYVR